MREVRTPAEKFEPLADFGHGELMREAAALRAAYFAKAFRAFRARMARSAGRSDAPATGARA